MRFLNLLIRHLMFESLVSGSARPNGNLKLHKTEPKIRLCNIKKGSLIWLNSAYYESLKKARWLKLP